MENRSYKSTLIQRKILFHRNKMAIRLYIHDKFKVANSYKSDLEKNEEDEKESEYS